MMEYKLNIGDVVTSSEKATYTCYGLGSCIGLFIQDRVIGISGGAHILLPGNEEGVGHTNKFYNVSLALREILDQFKIRGSNLTTLRAKVTGGANVLGVYSQVGKKNAESVLQQLVEKQIYVAAVDVGGNFSRTAVFRSDSGNLTVRIPETNESKIL